jgi:hypothetical protein
MAGVVLDGPDGVYLVPFPECGGFDPGDIIEVDLDLDEWNRFLKQSDTMETEILKQAADGTIVKAMVRKCERLIAGQVSWNVFLRDGFKCRYCGCGDRPLTVDHLWLWEEGGPSTEANLVAACKKCNKARGRTPYEEWLHHPYYQRVSQLLTAAGRAANEAVLTNMGSIEKLARVRSR